MTSSTVEQPKGLYDIIHERDLVGEKQLPTQDVLTEAESALSAVEEFLISEIARAVAAVGSVGEPGSITFEDIGRLIVWADHVRDRADSIAEDAAKVAVVAHESYTVASGFQGDMEMLFSEDGRVVDYEYFAKMRRRYWADDA